jgi:GTPase
MSATGEQPKPAAADMEAFLSRTKKKICFVSTAGSVDDGKSTLIGRLLRFQR